MINYLIRSSLTHWSDQMRTHKLATIDWTLREQHIDHLRAMGLVLCMHATSGLNYRLTFRFYKNLY